MPKKKPLVDFQPWLFAQIDLSKMSLEVARDLGTSSQTKVWWMGDCGHTWKSSIVSRVAGKGCPVCSGHQVLPGTNDLESMAPNVAKEWHPTKNKDLLPSQVSLKSGIVVWWKAQCGHEYKAKIGERVRGLADRPDTNGCPVCLNRKFVPGVNDLQSLRPDIAAELHPTLNGSITASSLNVSAPGKYWWLCSEGHEYRQNLRAKTKANQGCPICRNLTVVEGLNDLATTNPELLDSWDFERNGELKPELVVAGTLRKIHWRCLQGHHWTATGAKRVSGQGCPVCANRVLLGGFNDLESRAPEIAISWNQARNGTLTPRDVLYGTHRKFWWKCEEDHEWVTSPVTRQRTGCPRCAKSGFDQSKPGILYFIEHPGFRSRKVGIANSDSDRIKNWLRLGWRLVYKFESENGLLVMNIETEMLCWIRRDLDLPQHLGIEEMSRFGGATETFSQDGITNEDVISRIRELIAIEQ